MKICVTSSGPALDNPVDPRFGRSQYFIILDTDTMQFESIENPSISAGGGAGSQSAQLVANKGVEVVLTGNAGPNAFSALQAADIKIIVGLSNISVKEAVEGFKKGQYQYISEPSVASHYGMGAGAGMGSGRGMRSGMGSGMSPGAAPNQTQSSPHMSKHEEMAMLKEQSEKMRKELDNVEKRINDLAEKRD
ncbi:MAG: NifB/NifX family molybdenum-iron cluster-binding protein [Spirochaetota bacterium]|nr:NifB/NifX family molybdenum-iron cluster-binding protein [Spirochaetota bacterium]